MNEDDVVLEPQEVELIIRLIDSKLEKVNRKEITQDQILYKQELLDLKKKIQGD